MSNLVYSLLKTMEGYTKSLGSTNIIFVPRHLIATENIHSCLDVFLLSHRAQSLDVCLKF